MIVIVIVHLAFTSALTSRPCVCVYWSIVRILFSFVYMQ